MDDSTFGAQSSSLNLRKTPFPHEHMDVGYLHGKSPGEALTGYDPADNCVQSVYLVRLRWIQLRLTVNVSSLLSKQSLVYAADIYA